MYGHVNHYLQCEALRLRAERAEGLVRAWRSAAFILLALLAVQTWLVFDTATEMGNARRLAETRLDSVSVWHVAATNQTNNLLDCKADEAEWFKAMQHIADKRWKTQDELQECRDDLSVWSGQSVDHLAAGDAAEKKFRVCLAANAGLVESLHEFDRLVKDQQQVIRDSIEAAKRCEASPVRLVDSAGWEVVGAHR